MTVTGVRGYCADLLLRSLRVRRLLGWEVYFCQPVISDRFNYTLINQMVKSGRVWPAPAQMACICVGVIPQIHLFNFSPSSFWFPRFLAGKSVMVLIGAQRRGPTPRRCKIMKQNFSSALSFYFIPCCQTFTHSPIHLYQEIRGSKKNSFSSIF